MAETSNQDNLLMENHFVFNLEGLSKYHCAKAEVPSITLGQVDVNNTFVKTPQPGDKITYDQLSITIRVSEDMSNYLEIFDWVTSIGYPESFDQYSAYTQSDYSNSFKDATLHIYDGNYKEKVRVSYKNVFPVSIGPLQFDAASTDALNLECTVQFAIQSFSIEVVKDT